MQCKLRFTAVFLLAGLGVCVSSAQQAAPLRLTLQEAIHRALLANLNVLTATTKVEEAEGTRARRLSAALLPRVNAQAYANVQNRDLRAFGISLPGMPEVVGPFSNYDFRVYAQQNIVELEPAAGIHPHHGAGAQQIDEILEQAAVEEFR